MITRPFKSAAGFCPHISFFLSFYQGLQGLSQEFGDALVSPSRRPAYLLWCVFLFPPLSPLPPKTLPQAPGLILLQLDQIWPFSIIWEQWIPDYYSLLLHGELLSFSDKTFFSVLLKIGSLLMWKVWVGSAGKLKCDVRTMLENSYYSGDIVNRGKNYLKNCRFISFRCLTMFWRNQDLPHSKDYLFTSNWFQWQ